MCAHALFMSAPDGEDRCSVCVAMRRAAAMQRMAPVCRHAQTAIAGAVSRRRASAAPHSAARAMRPEPRDDAGPPGRQAEVEEAAKLANAHSFICALPQGYATQARPGKAGPHARA